MLVQEILHTNIAPLGLEDTVALATTKMDLMNTTKFPVIDHEEKLVGMIALDTLISVVDEETVLAHVKLEDPLFVPDRQHLFEAARLMLAHELYALPVVDADLHFKGFVKKKQILKALGNMLNLSSYGSVITIELGKYDFTLSELVRLIESEEAKILGIAVQQPDENNSNYRVSFKLNVQDSSAISTALRRFGYAVTSEANSESLEMNLSDRADELIRYLDI